MVTGQAPVTLELRENTHNPSWYTHIPQLTQFMPPKETYKSKIGSQSTMCHHSIHTCMRLKCVRLSAHSKFFAFTIPKCYTFPDRRWGSRPLIRVVYVLRIVANNADDRTVHSNISGYNNNNTSSSQSPSTCFHTLWP